MRNATLKRTERISVLLQNITYHVTCRFQSESTLYSLRECQGTPYSKQAPYLSWVFVYELSGCGFESRCCQCKIIITCFSTDNKVPKVKVLANAFSNTQFYYASMIWMFAGKRWYQKFKKIYYRTLHIVNEKSYEDLLFMNDAISIYQNHLHFLAKEIFKSVINLNLQFMWNYFSFKPIVYELRKGMYFSAAGSTWQGINYLLFCGSLLGNALHVRSRKLTLQKLLNQNLEKSFLHLYWVSINIRGVFIIQSALTALNLWQFLREATS